MLGAIIGDIAGSIYEYGQVKKVKKVKIDEFIKENSFYSDDTILTIAIADAILSKSDYESKLKQWAKKYMNYIPNTKPYFPTIFSPGFTEWVNGKRDGTSGGNGAMMRISPVGFLFDSEKDVIKNARLATIPSHNSEQAIKCATTIALIIFYSKKGLTKEEIIEKLKLKIVKPKLTKFNYTCIDTLDLCLYSFFNANSFKEGIDLAISFGGDTDTNACIVGGMCEAMYGIPNDLKQQALSKLPKDMLRVLKKIYKHNS